jgi:hypothetical protein
MKLSKLNKELIDNECEFALNKMENSSSPDEILYYFTAFYNVMNRVYNIEFSEELLFVNFVMEGTYNSIMSRMGSIKSGQSTVVTFHENFGSALIKITRDIKENFYNKPKRNQALQKLVLLSFTTTGNGFYLSQKNKFDLPIGISDETTKMRDKKDKA